LKDRERSGIHSRRESNSKKTGNPSAADGKFSAKKLTNFVSEKAHAKPSLLMTDNQNNYRTNAGHGHTRTISQLDANTNSEPYDSDFGIGRRGGSKDKDFISQNKKLVTRKRSVTPGAPKLASDRDRSSDLNLDGFSSLENSSNKVASKKFLGKAGDGGLGGGNPRLKKSKKSVGRIDESKESKNSRHTGSSLAHQ
jgi:hypothetical protein